VIHILTVNFILMVGEARTAGSWCVLLLFIQ